MRNKSVLVIVILVSLILNISDSMSQEDVVSSSEKGNKITQFIPRPDLGYVIKTKTAPGVNKNILSTTQGETYTDDIKSVGGSGFKNVYVVKGQSGNVQFMQLLSSNSQNDIEYMLPLFEVNGEILALMPKIIVRLNNANDYYQLAAFCQANDCAIVRNIVYTDLEYLIEPLQKNESVLINIIEELNKNDFIEWAFPDIALDVELCGYEGDIIERIDPNDEYYTNQWHLENINAPQAWTITQGDPNIVVAVIDTSFDINHPDLKDNIWTNPNEIPGNGIDDDENGFVDDVHGWNFVNDNNDVLNNSNEAHGTACAGLIAAKGNNNIGVAGVAWNCKIMPIRALGGEFECVSGMALEEALRYAAAQGADVISNSWGLTVVRTYIFPWGIYTYVSPYDCQYVRSAINDICKINGVGRNGKGCVVLAASGNWEDDNQVVYPAAYSNVIAVGAVDNENSLWYYSGYGSSLDIVAPSGDVGLMGDLWTTDITENRGYNNRNQTIEDYTDKMGGTSGSCPITAGVAALILSIDPNLTNTEVQNILCKSAKDLGSIGWDKYYGYGSVDAYSAVNMALNPQFVVYVDDNAPDDPGPDDTDISDPNEDGSKKHPFDSIQEAIQFANVGDKIIVLPGIYTGEGNYNISFLDKNITLQSKDGPESCIIDCQNKGRGFNISSKSSVVLEGFSIINGNAETGSGLYNYGRLNMTNCIFSGNSADYGGGLYDNTGNLIITNCTFSGNFANINGGGIYHYKSSSSIITNCTFSGNSADKDGGGMFNYKSDPTITDCTFSGNFANGYGGGAYNLGYAKITNCTFSGNTAVSGGGFYNYLRIPTITNCILSGNSADNGAGLYNHYGNPVITNCTFSKNTANENGGGMYNYGSDIMPVLNNCIIWSNMPNQLYGSDTYEVSYSDIQDGWLGNGNIDADPLFADLDNEDYHLKSQSGRYDPITQSWIQDNVTSPCVDTGDPNSPIGFELFPHGTIINMGAFGGTEQASKSLSDAEF